MSRMISKKPPEDLGPNMRPGSSAIIRCGQTHSGASNNRTVLEKLWEDASQQQRPGSPSTKWGCQVEPVTRNNRSVLDRSHGARMNIPGGADDPSPSAMTVAPEPFALRVDAACAYIGLSRTSLYALIRQQKLRSVRVGGRRLFLREDLEALVRGGSHD